MTTTLTVPDAPPRPLPGDRAATTPAEPTSAPRPAVEVVVPVHDEEDDLERSVRALRAYLDEHVPYDVLVTIADNASTDGTPALAVRLAQELDGVRAVVLERKGRGRALAAVWGASRAEVVAYMDVDLSTDLAAFRAWWPRSCRGTATSRSAPAWPAARG